MAHLNPQGWFSAGLPPITRTTSAFLMSTQPLVIAPRPYVAARLATVGPCQTLAWLSRYGMPSALMNFHCRKLNSLVSVHPPTMARPGVRFTVCPFAFLATKVLSRVVLMCRAIPWMAPSQEMSSQWSEPGRRTFGLRIRFGLSMSYLSVEPFGQSVPRLVGWSGSPSTCTTVGATFFALSPSVWMMTPHATAQYGQMLRVSVVRAILNCRISARARDMSNPIPTAAPATAAPFKNVLRLIVPPRRLGRPDTLPSSRSVPARDQPEPGRSGAEAGANAGQFCATPVDRQSDDPLLRRGLVRRRLS